MNFLSDRNRIPLPWINFCPKFRNYRTRWILLKDQKVLYDPEQLLLNAREFRVPEERVGAILVCHTTHGTRWVSQETFFWRATCSRREGHLHHSSKTQGSWHFLADWHQVTQEVQWSSGRDWDESRRVQQFWLLDFAGSMKLGESFISYWRIFSKLYDGCSDVFCLGIAFRKILRPRWLPVLRSQFKYRSVCEHTLPSTHNVVDQRSGDGKINGRLFDVAFIEGTHFPDFEMLDAKIASVLRKIQTVLTMYNQ